MSSKTVSQLIGRTKELKLLKDLCASKDSQFIAVYGRRRIGKTFLLRNFFSTQGIYLEVTGLKDGSKKQQLEVFTKALSTTFLGGLSLLPPNSWMKAFELLTKQIEQTAKSKKIIVFLDELPWLATKKSDLLQALDHFWNTRWEKIPQLRLVVCGSAASWMLEKLINAKGGLYNRITKSLRLEPFNLNETALFLKSRGINFNTRQIADLYMVTGGVPHYLKEIKKGKSAVQNVNNICFQENGLLLTEFPKIFASLYDESEIHEKIMHEVYAKRYGITRSELVNRLNLSSGGTLTKRLRELIESGFIMELRPYNSQREDIWYRICDEYTSFYYKWIEPVSRKSKSFGVASDYWQTKSKSPAFTVWAGYAFENLCFKHVRQVAKALGLEGINYQAGSWKVSGKKGSTTVDGAQIDLLFDRDDGMITICEIKYCINEYSLTKDEALRIRNKILQFETHVKPYKKIEVALIASTKIKKNIWTENLIDHMVELEDLFR